MFHRSIDNRTQTEWSRQRQRWLSFSPALCPFLNRLAEEVFP
jgi:hypothetical protein